MTKICEVWDSSLIDQTIFDADEKSLIVIFKNSGQHYKYCGITEDEYNSFTESSSQGKWFLENIKNNSDYTVVKL